MEGRVSGESRPLAGNGPNKSVSAASAYARGNELRFFFSYSVLTGEEEDETIHSVRGKLYVLSGQNQWKERGTGLLRLNRRRVDRGGARLGEPSLFDVPRIFKLTVIPLFFRGEVMRKDAVFAVLLNVTLFRGMSCAIAQDPRYLRFSVLTPGGTIHYNLRVRFLLSL